MQKGFDLCVYPRNYSLLLQSIFQDYPHLRRLLEKVDTVAAVQYLPEILQLMRYLCETFHSKYSREEARQTLLSSLHQQQQEKVTRWLQNYVRAWNMSLKSQDCTYNC